MNILLTGATGFLGKQLTIRLLQEGHSVYALARNEKKSESLMESVPTALQPELTVVKGDIGKENVGVSEEAMEELKDTIDTVYHIAAYLSFDDTEKEQLFDINVNGTKRILDLSRYIRVKRFFHVSTAYTLGDQLHAEEELHPLDNPFVNYYEKSKCEAEHLVFSYEEFFNVNIFRPSIIVGDSQTGEADTTFALYGVMRSFEIMKKRLDRQKTSPDNKIKFLCNRDTAQNIVPIDYVVDVLTAGLTHAENKKIYHITNSNPPSNQVVFEALKRELNFYNVQLVPTDYQGELTEQELRFNEPMKVFHQYLDKTLTFDDSNTQELLKKDSTEPLDLNDRVLKTIIAGR